MMVYVMKWPNGHYKIGYTAQTIRQRYPVRRLRAGVILVIENASEADIHYLMRHARLKRGQWEVQFEHFDLTQPDIDKLLSLPGAKKYEEPAIQRGRTKKTKRI